MESDLVSAPLGDSFQLGPALGRFQAIPRALPEIYSGPRFADNVRFALR